MHIMSGDDYVLFLNYKLKFGHTFSFLQHLLSL